jgi:hypothetical protein
MSGLRITLAITAIWYFIFYSSFGVAQIGPFATLTACDNFRTSAVNTIQFTDSTACFSTTAKQ